MIGDSKFQSRMKENAMEHTRRHNDHNELSQSNEDIQTENPEEPEVDEEGLSKSGYDVVLCGTNLIHSILASALALAGKKILHCDGADYYGEVDASMDLKNLLEWAEVEQKKKSRSISNCNQGSDSGQGTKENIDWESVSLNANGSWAGVTIHSYSSTHKSKDDTCLNELTRNVPKKVVTPYGIGSIIETTDSINSIAISLDGWTLADGKSPVLFTKTKFPPDESSKSILDYKNEAISLSRRFILDLTTQGPLLLANSKAVSGLLSSNVADYVEFKSVQALHILLPSNPSSKSRTSIRMKKSSSVASQKNADENKIDKDSDPLSLHRVPCSKGDVFQTSLLSPLEKRKLMKFLQLISDYGISEQEQKLLQKYQEEHQQNPPSEGESKTIKKDMEQQMQNLAIQSLNERKLNQGRSLKRPQNKTISITSLQDLKSIMNSEDNDSDQPHYFHTYLQKILKLSPRLTDLIQYSLAMQAISTNKQIGEDPYPCKPTTVQKGITALVEHLHSLGRFGKTGFLMPLYGSGELSQSFCRSAAVHGGTYLLRRCPKEIVMSKNKDSLGVRILGDPEFDMEQREKVVKAKHVVVSTAAISTNSCDEEDIASISTSRIVKRISIIHGGFPNLQKDSTSPSLGGEEDGKSMIVIIPPMTPHIENTHAIQGVILDHSANVSAQGYSVVYLCTTAENHEVSKNMSDEVLVRATSLLLSKANSNLKENETKLEEVHHVCFSVMNELNSNTEQQTKEKLSSPNVHRSNLPSQSLTVENAFEEAKRIFFSICGNNKNNEENQEALKFLQICTTLLKIREEQRNGGYGDMDEDDEKMALESALSMIDSEKEKTEAFNPKDNEAMKMQPEIDNN